MTQRYKGFVVALKDDVREDDAEAVMNALRMVKGVLAVTPVENSHEDYIVAERVRRELWEKIYGIFYPRG